MPAADPRELVNERAVQTMTHVVTGRSAVEFRIPEVLVVLEAGDVVRGEIAALRGLALAQRVVDIPRVPVREPLAKPGLQPVVDHGLTAVHVVAARRSERRVRPRTGLPVEGLRELPLQGEIVAIGPTRAAVPAADRLSVHLRLALVGRHVASRDGDADHAMRERNTSLSLRPLRLPGRSSLDARRAKAGPLRLM